MAIRSLACAVLLAAISSGALAVDSPEREPRALDALQKMSDYMRSLQRFQISADSTTDQVLDSGQTIQFSHHTELKAERPNRLQVTVSDGLHRRSLYYDGNHFVVYGDLHNYYSRLVAPPNIDSLLEQLEGRYGIQLPLADLFYWSNDRSLRDNIHSAAYIGTEKLAGKTCEHYAYRQDGIDWQLWVESGPQPLPCQLVIISSNDEARPRHSVRLHWQPAPTFTTDTFDFQPPTGAQAVELRQLDTNQPQQSNQ
ncbi:DUF2092 domain-containing protein [Pseudomonas sp. LS44]|uniref:DUF2092 domain-containing protein n=1 Tax=Pseudomonas sp. LS44 TaxID=1357074 RepID=UPI00215A5D32|nr:DUF2092 domain-containing protein [Pseudomonas sp. LS44]UVE16218.1 DUF2092 domain-containing protein [Pseudomonas sp. LS44]